MAGRYAAALIVIVLLYVVWRLKRYFSFWSGQGIPYLTFTDYMVHLYDIFTKPYSEALMILCKKYGQIFGSYNFGQPTLFISDPELVKQVLVKDFASFSDRLAAQKTGHKWFDLMVGNLSGQEWKETRDIITPAFTSGKMRQMISAVEETSQFTVDNFVQAAQKKEPIIVKELFGAYSLDIIARIAFATKLNSHKDPNSEFVKHAKAAFGKDSSRRFTFALLTMDSIIAQCVLFFIAGYDTTGTTLSLIAYYLAVNPDVQEKLIEEIDTLDKNQELTYESINSLHYVEAVINETFRISGNISSHVRMCTENTEVGGVKIKKDMLVMIPIHFMMQQPEFYSEPEKFKPERFLPENKSSIQPYTFIPFGEGPRHCLGMRLAMMVIKVIIIKLLQKVRLAKCAETPVPLEPIPRILSLHFKNPIKLAAVERT